MKVFHFYPTGLAKKILEEWNFDYIIFSAAYTSFYNLHFNCISAPAKHHYISIAINATEEVSYGYYNYEDEIFLCSKVLECKDLKKSQKQLFATIMHEMMHWNQYNVFKWDEQDISPEKKIFSSSAERMCRKYEKQTKYVMQLYKTMLKIPIGQY
jgi:hypothetical protein